MNPDFEEALRQENEGDLESRKQLRSKKKKEEEEEESFTLRTETPKFTSKSIIIKPKTKVTIKKKDNLAEIIDNNDSCMKFYEPTLELFKRNNLPCGKRRWVPSKSGNKIGIAAFNDPIMYRPGDMYNYIQKYYVDYFEENETKSPFAYDIKNIDKPTEEVHTNKEYTVQPHQKFGGQYMSSNSPFRSVLVYNHIGSGKCLAINTPVITYDGKIKMVQDVEVGDLLMGDDSTPREVLTLGRGQDVMYDIVPVKGEVYTCNSKHILSLTCTNYGVHKIKNETYKKKWIATWFNNKTIKTECKYFEFKEEAEKHLEKFDEKSKICNIEVKDYLKLSKYMKSTLKIYRVPVQFPRKDVPFDPYIIGYWIGDGASEGPKITSQDSTVLLYFKKKMAEYKLNFFHYSKLTYGISSSNKDNTFLNTLKELNLINNKHIPDIYKINSRQVRLELLAGLIDSDGHLSGNCYEFTQKNEKTMDGVIYIARTLGFAAYKSVKKTSWMYKGIKNYGTAFRTTISGNISEIPCKVPRKKASTRNQEKNVLVSGFKLVEKPIDNYYGFNIDGNSLFLLGDCTVTHNTPEAILIGELNKGYYINNGNMEMRQGSEIYKKNIGAPGHSISPCIITIVVPKNLINQYLDEIKGSVENGKIKSPTASCVFVETDDQIDENYVKMRQYYSGRLDSSGNPNIRELNDIVRLEELLIEKEGERFEYSIKNKRATENYIKVKFQDKLNKIGVEIKKIEDQLKNKKTLLDSNINKIYYIVSHDIFLNLITEKKKGGFYTTSNFVLGKPYDKKRKEVLIHPDCFHTDKSVLIIDEVQRITRERGTNYLRLYDTLMINARDKKTGEPRMKVVLLTATPIYDNPHEASLMMNFLRPRIQFPLSRQRFDDFFIDPIKNKIINKICYQYLWSGYVGYSRGANPKSFPYRRNITVCHEFSSKQFSGYLRELKNESKRDKRNGLNSTPTEKNKFSILPQDNDDDTIQGKYLKPRQICNIYLPKKASSVEYDWDIDNVDKNEDNDKNSKNDFYNFINDLRSYKDPEKILEAYKEYSPKFHYILKKIIDSKNEGPIVVYSEWVWYGILGMTRILELLGWEFSNSQDFENTGNKLRFGIWSSLALTEMNISTPEMQEKYTSSLQKVFNHKNNTNGKLCKVIFITVVEGINLKRVSQLHVTSPWWNQSKTEQVIGRGIRFFSHTDLHKSKQYVDVYYHCTVFDTFKNYPEVNKTVSVELCEAINGPNSYVSKYRHPQDLDRLTVEQKVYIKARSKNDINTQFEMAIKETAVDWQLNKYGNIIRFEEIFNNYMKFTNMEKSDSHKIFYNRSENKHYLYNMDTNDLFNLEVHKKNDKNKDLWPSLQCTVENKVSKTYWEKRNIEIYTNDKNETMVSYIVIEKIESFNNDKNFRDKNFQELMDYAINVKNEDPVVWNYFESQRIKESLFNILVSVYNLTVSDGSDQLLSNFTERVTNGSGEYTEMKRKIENGTATKDLAEELLEISKKQNNTEAESKLKKVIKDLPVFKPLTGEQISKNNDSRNKFFFLLGEDKLEKIKKVLIGKFNFERNYLEELNPVEISKLYNDLTIKERNTKKEKPKQKFTII
jgi:hypothetical protein